MDKNKKKQLAYLFAARMSIPFDDFRSIRNVSIANFIATDDTRIMKLIVGINPVQSGTGDPSPDNVRPISGFTGLTVYRTGKNLINQDGIDASNGYLHKSYIRLDGTIGSAEGDWDVMEYTPVLPSTQYTISGLTANNVTGYAEYDADKNMVASVAYRTAPFTFTTTSKTRYVRFNRNYADDNAIMLNLGSAAETYAPYQGTTYPVSWQSEAGTVYGGTLDVVSGLLTVTMASVDLGTLTFVKQEASQSGRFDAILAGKAVGEKNIICSQYKTVSAAQMPTSDYCIRGVSVNENIVIVDTAYSNASAADFKTAMSGVQLVYELAAPQTYQLDPVDIQPLLGENNIWADTGDILILDLNY